jgi:hypothetical protein
MNAHGSSLLGGSATLTTLVDRSTYLAKPIDKLLSLQITARARPYANPTDNSTSPQATDKGDKADQPTDTRRGITTRTITL